MVDSKIKNGIALYDFEASTKNELTITGNFFFKIFKF